MNDFSTEVGGLIVPFGGGTYSWIAWVTDAGIIFEFEEWKKIFFTRQVPQVTPPSYPARLPLQYLQYDRDDLLIFNWILKKIKTKKNAQSNIFIYKNIGLV